MSTHWTARSIANYRYSVISSFLMQLERKMLEEDIKAKDLAARLNLTQGRVSQILNGKLGNFSVEKIVAYAKALDLDVSIVAYSNGDVDRGPINPEIFTQCWEKMGKPQDFFELEQNDEDKVPETTYTDEPRVTDANSMIYSKVAVLADWQRRTTNRTPASADEQKLAA